jgi:hypothetical protein
VKSNSPRGAGCQDGSEMPLDNLMDLFDFKLASELMNNVLGGVIT